jgi:hypothetical protein
MDGRFHVIKTGKHVFGINNGMVVVLKDVFRFMTQFPDIIGTNASQAEND